MKEGESRRGHTNQQGNQPDQSPHGGGSNSPERQPLPSVWNYLECFTRLNALEVEDRPRWGTQEYKRKFGELNRLVKELREKGTTRDNLILSLHAQITLEPANLPIVAWPRDLSLEEFQQFRSKIEPLSDEEISEELRKAEEEFERKTETTSRDRNPDDPYSLTRQ